MLCKRQFLFRKNLLHSFHPRMSLKILRLFSSMNCSIFYINIFFCKFQQRNLRFPSNELLNHRMTSLMILHRRRDFWMSHVLDWNDHFSDQFVEASILNWNMKKYPKNSWNKSKLQVNPFLKPSFIHWYDRCDMKVSEVIFVLKK